MFDAIARLFTATDDDRLADSDPRLAVAALLVHLAAVDGHVSDVEKQAASRQCGSEFPTLPAAVR